MKLMRSSLALASVIAVGVVATGCTVAPAPDYYVTPCYYNDCPVGTVIISWSIDGDSTGAQCKPHGAAQIEVSITDANGNAVDDWKLPCTAASEGTTETLPGGIYNATAQLEDANGNPVTTADPTQIDIPASGQVPTLDFSFPDNSFTNSK